MKTITFLMITAVAVGMVRRPEAAAVTLQLEPATTTMQVGEPFGLNIVAAIAGSEAIIGFGFDLQVSGSGGVTLFDSRRDRASLTTRSICNHRATAMAFAALRAAVCSAVRR